MNSDKFFSFIILAVLLGLVFAAGIPIYKSVTADGRVEYCYTEMVAPDGMAPQYKLMAFRNWREDRRLGVYPNLEDARKAADTFGCKMGVR
jgi:hypothetical protein